MNKEISLGICPKEATQEDKQNLKLENTNKQRHTVDEEQSNHNWSIS